MTEIPSAIIHIILFISLYFEVFLLLTFFQNKNKEEDKKNKNRGGVKPSVSVIIPCYNEENALRRTVDSILNLNYPKGKLYVFIVDDGSKDNTLEIAKEYSRTPNVKVLSKENGGKHTAINLALEESKTDIVACLDADSFVEKESLNEIIKLFEVDENVMAVTPVIKVHKPKSIPQFIQKSEYMFSAFIRKTFSFVDSQFVTPGPFSIFKREIFEKVGLFKESHNTEDMEMCLRIQSFKYKIKNSPEAIVYTNAPKDLRSLFRQRVRWTYGFLKNAVDYKFMFFKPKYGSLGLFVLPMIAFSVFSATFFFGYILIKTGGNLLVFFEKIKIIGTSFPKINSDFFLINTDIIPIITFIILFMTISIIMIGKYISKEEKRWTPDVLFYIFLYGLLAPIWLGKSIFDAAFSRRGSWTKEHDKR